MLTENYSRQYVVNMYINTYPYFANYGGDNFQTSADSWGPGKGSSVKKCTHSQQICLGLCNWKPVADLFMKIIPIHTKKMGKLIKKIVIAMQD